jgi:DNA-binding MarR family transcriptional regulator
MAKSRRNDIILSNAEARPRRSPAGEAFTRLVLDVTGLGTIFTAAGESLASLGNQTLARWVILDFIEDQPSTVAQIARRRGIARQAVQRVADLLEREGLAAYLPNPTHRRAKLLRPTARGRKVLRLISIEQKAWADALGAEIGEAKLQTVTRALQHIRKAVSSKPMPGVATAGPQRAKTPRWHPPPE